MVNKEVDNGGWQALAAAISAAMASGVLARDTPSWRAFERIRRAIAFGDHRRATALALIARRLHPDEYARVVVGVRVPG